MNIGVLGALDQEVALIKEQLEDLQLSEWAHLTFYSGTIKGTQVVLVKCGVGKVAASVATAVMIDRFAPDFVVNTGSAGGFDRELDIGDMIIASGVQHHDVDVTHFGYEQGQVFGMPAIYACDDRLIQAAEQASVELDHFNTKRGLIGTGDSFIGCDEASARLRQIFPDMLAVEMEGAAIGQTCHMLDTPFVVIRSLSDIASKESHESFQTYIHKAGKNSAELVLAMIDKLAE